MGTDSGKKPARRIGLAIVLALVLALLLLFIFSRTVPPTHGQGNPEQVQPGQPDRGAATAARNP